jgi:hypothetical protein
MFIYILCLIYSITTTNIFLSSLHVFKQEFLKNFRLVKKKEKNFKEQKSLKNLFHEKKSSSVNKNELDKNYQQAFIYKKGDLEFQNQFKDLKEKIINYLKKDLEDNSLIPINTKVYVLIEKNEILSSYPSLLYYRLNKLTMLGKQSLLERKEDLDYYNLYFKFLEKRKYRRLPRRPRFEYIDLFKVYENLTRKEHLQKRFIEQQIEQNPIVLGFLDKSDAIMYKKEILRSNFSFLKKRKKIKKRNNALLNYTINIKPTALLNIKDSLEEFSNVEKKDLRNTFILIPKFFNYSLINNTKKINLNFPKEMLSSFGFYGIPVYKTKQIEKKLLLRNSKNFQDLSIPLRYLKTKTCFITLNKREYQKLAKMIKRKIFFYEEEMNFTDNIRNVLNQQNLNYLKQTEKILVKLKTKAKTLEKLSLVKNFITNNYHEENLLEKTSYYIDKINKNPKQFN